MKLGIMQPYYFPYIGYWQLLNAVDEYVIYDDVTFIKGGWINRNRILINGVPKYFNIQMQGASSYKLINEIEISNNKNAVNKNLRTIVAAYSKAPFFDSVYPMIEQILTYEESILSLYIKKSFDVIMKYLDINTKIIISSAIEKNNQLKGKDKVIEICKLLGATEYYNACGGRDMYSYEDFKKQGIELSFLHTKDITYKQFNNEFYSNLSIIDVMMFNSREEIKTKLNDYYLTKD